MGDHINDELDPNLCWITAQSTKADDYSLVSVLMTNEQAKLIENYGNYNTDGTILQVRGTFYLSCSEHQGLSDIHAKEVTVVKQGSPCKHPVNDADALDFLLGGRPWRAELVHLLFLARTEKIICMQPNGRDRYEGAVIKLDRGYPLVSLSDGRTIRCEHATSLVKRKTDRAVIGDRVEVHLPEGHEKGIIEAIYPRTTKFVRKDPTERALPQTLASNFDLVLIAQPAEEVNFKRLDANCVGS